MSERSAEIAFHEMHFASLADYLAGTAQFGWQQEFRQLDHGSHPAAVKTVIGGMSQLLAVDYGNLIHQRIMPPPESLNFGILACPQAPIRLRAREVQAHSLMYFDRYDGLDALVRPGFSGITFSFDRELFCQIAAQHELPTPDDRLYFSTSARTRSAANTAGIQQLTQEILTLAAQSCAAPALQEALESTLPRLIHQCWHGGAQPGVARADGRARALYTALEYIDSYAQDAVTVEQLCRVSACSISTLERAFKDRFDISPKRYLVAARLCGVQRALLDRNDQRSITDVAMDWGFWHMGKFASDYRRLVGQLPSQTRQGQRCAATVPAEFVLQASELDTQAQ